VAESFSTNASGDGHTVELPAVPSRGGGKRGRPFGDYVVEREVARGGMGIVYRATRKSDGAVVALKIIKQGPQASPRQVRRFQRETEAARILEHPGIVRIYKVGCSEGYHFYTMELVEGESLYALLKRKQRLEVKDAIEMVALSAEAAHYAHEMGVVHRDLKPANILLTLDGKPKLTDFGLAKRVSDKSHLRRTDHVVGTPYYMPPEQARGDMDLDRRADVYALGVILFELLALRVPFQGTTSMEVYQHVLNSEPPSLRELDPRVDESLERIVFQTMAKGLNDRYATALEFAQDLRRYLAGEPVKAKAPAWVRKRSRELRRRIALWGSVVLVAAGATAGVLYSRTPPEPSTPPAVDEDAIAAETKRRETLEAADALLSGLLEQRSLEGLSAAEGKLTKVEQAVALLAEGGEGWVERSKVLDAKRRLASARLAVARGLIQGPGADWSAIADQLGELDGEDTALEILEAQALVGADRLDDAAALLEDVLERDPYAQEVALAQVELQLWRGEGQAARSALKTLLTQDPDSPRGLQLSTHVELRRGSLREALSHLDAWSRSAAGDLEVHWLRAQIAWEAGETGLLRVALKRLPTGQPPQLAAEAALKLLEGDPAGALTGFQAALKADPGLAPATLGVATAQHALGQDEAALATLDALAKRTDPRGRWLRSRALATSGRLQLVPAWNELHQGDGSASAERAEALFARAREAAPVAAQAFRGGLELAWIRGDVDALEGSLDAVRTHLGLSPVDPWAESQPDAEPGLGWLSCWEGELHRLRGDGKAARRAFGQVRSGPSAVWASAGREASSEGTVRLEGPRGAAPAWLAPILTHTPSVFPRDELARRARAGEWESVAAALQTLAQAPAPRAAASRWLAMLQLGEPVPELVDAPEIPEALRDPAAGAKLLLRSLEAQEVEWASLARALAARAEGDSARALELALRDAEERPTAMGWRLVSELKRAAGDAAGADEAAQRAESLDSQRR